MASTDSEELAIHTLRCSRCNNDIISSNDASFSCCFQVYCDPCWDELLYVLEATCPLAEHGQEHRIKRQPRPLEHHATGVAQNKEADKLDESRLRALESNPFHQANKQEIKALKARYMEQSSAVSTLKSAHNELHSIIVEHSDMLEALDKGIESIKKSAEDFGHEADKVEKRIANKKLLLAQYQAEADEYERMNSPEPRDPSTHTSTA